MISIPIILGNSDNNFAVYEVETSNTSGTGAAVQLKRKVFDDKLNIINQETQNIYYMTALNKPLDFGEIQLVYGGNGWELKALAPVYVANKVHQTGEKITHWGYATTVKLLIVSGGVTNRLLNFLKTLFLRKRGAF